MKDDKTQLIDEYAELAKQIKELEKRQKEIKEKLSEYLESSNMEKLEGDTHVAKWILYKRWDYKSLCKDYRFDPKYIVVTRILRIEKLK